MSGADLWARFEARAAAAPDTVALIEGDAPVTLGALQARAVQVAAALAPRIEAGERVGLLARRSADMVAAMLGILGAGGAYVPLDPDDPPERLARILDVADCKVAVGHAAPFAALTAGREGAPALVDLDALPEAPAEFAPKAGGGLAYVLFTSGSTGAPKGVEVTHSNAASLLDAAAELIGWGEGDRYLAQSTIGFDISVVELLLPLTAGGSLLLRDRAALMAPRTLAADIARHGVTVMQTGPSAWAAILGAAPDFPRLRVAISTGEAITPDQAAALAERADLAWNLYGPTETTIWATGHRLSAADAGRGGGSAPIGRPLANARALILTETGAEAAEGEAGELCIGGDGVARGYLGDPALTEARFFSRGGEGGPRFYRTGDLAARGADGEIRYLGRLDDQLSIRGVRIEPGEIEAALRAHPGVGDAAATWHETPGGRAVLAAATGASGTPAPEHAALRAWLEDRIPAPALPTRILRLDALPLTPAAKVDRARLRAMAARPEAPAQAAAAPAEDSEAAVLAILRRLLERPGLGPADDFFEAGGDSLGAVALIAEIERRLGVELPVQTVFEAPDARRLARKIEARRGGPSGAAFIFPLVEAGEGTPVFFNGADLRLATRGLWTRSCPLYAVSHWAQGRGFVQARSLAELAARHVSGMRAIQPEGPWRLAGHGFGALVALEMAAQVRDEGGEVEELFLLAPMSPARIEGEAAALPMDPDGGVGRRAWEWLVYRAAHLHGRRPNPVSELLVPKGAWPSFWHASRRLRKGHAARAADVPATAVFSSQGPDVEVWRRLLGPSARIVTLDLPAGWEDLFAEPVAGRWTPLMAPEPVAAPPRDTPPPPPEAEPPGIAADAEVMRRLELICASWQGERVSQKAPMFRLNPDGSLPVLAWCANAAGEMPLWAEALGPEQPVLSMRSIHEIVAPGTEKRRQAARMAALYAGEIMRLHPTGPVLVGGTCQGADIAAGIARRLMEQGRDVPLLCLVEAEPETPYPGRVALFFARDSEEFNPFKAFARPQEGWRRLCREVSWDVVPGNHGTFFRRPWSDAFARRLKARMAEALARRPATLPPEAFAAEVLATGAPDAMAPGGRANVVARARNSGPVPWPAEGVSLAARWHRGGGGPAMTAAAAPLPGPVAPGECCEAVLALRAPLTPGRWTLEIDLCEEGVAWFADRGSTPFRAELDVEGAALEAVEEEALSGEAGPPLAEGLAAARLGRSHEGAALLAAAAGEAAEAFVELARSEAALGRHEAASRGYRAALAARPDDVELALEAAEHMIAAGDRAGARAALAGAGDDPRARALLHPLRPKIRAARFLRRFARRARRAAGRLARPSG